MNRFDGSEVEECVFGNWSVCGRFEDLFDIFCRCVIVFFGIYGKDFEDDVFCFFGDFCLGICESVIFVDGDFDVV